MRGLLVCGLLSVMVVAVCGCVGPSAPMMGMIYTDVTGPGGVGDASGFSKVGQSEATGIICVATGDASIEAAMKDGGITKVHHVDVKYMSILGLYGKATTTVYGE